MKSSLYIFAILGCISTISHAASFNCDKAQTKTEYAICEHRNLNDADVKMATTYNIVRHLVPMGTRSIIQDQQIKWLKLRDDCRDSVSCLTDVYKMQQQRLDKYMSRIYQQGPF